MKTKLQTASLICCLTLFASTVCAETATVVRADTDNSWATLGRLYVILATTDHDEPYGKIASNNSSVVEQLFKTHVAKDAITLLKIAPQHLNRQTVLQLIANLPLRGEDAVMFYYSGKGDIDRKHGQYFELPTTKEELYRSEVRDAITSKNPRLCVLVADFCDPVVATSNQNTVPNQNEGKEEPKASASATASLFFELFFVNRGIVDITSGESGQVSGANENGVGYFTDAFARLLAVNGNKALAWRRVFPYVQKDTSLAFEKNFSEGADIGGGRKQNTQTPVLLQFGDNVVASPTQLGIYPPNAAPSTDTTETANEERREEDRKIVQQLIQQAMGDLRPFDTADQGTHENYKTLDVDNTFLGRSGEPFSTRVSPVEIADAGSSEGDATPPSQPLRLGIQAASNQGDGVVITRVMDGYPGARAGLRVGTVILVINDRRITSDQDYSETIDTATDRLVLRVRHPGVGIPVTITIDNFVHAE